MVTGVDIYIIITEAVCLEGFVYFAVYIMHMCAMCAYNVHALRYIHHVLYHSKVKVLIHVCSIHTYIHKS